jgi:L-amino acid N-acyltransferase YncA
MNIRKAKAADIEGIAFVHTESWKTTYRGLISDEYLGRITLEARRTLWNRNFAAPHKDEIVYVAEDTNGRIIGFASGGACRETDLNYEAELYAIYLLQEHQSCGIGKQLLCSVTSDLSARQYRSLMAWVLEGNPALFFYQKAGGIAVASKDIQIGNEKLREIAVGWNSLD